MFFYSVLYNYVVEDWCRINVRINAPLIRVHRVGCGEETVKLSAHFCKYNFGDKRSINDIVRVAVQVRVAFLVTRILKIISPVRGDRCFKYQPVWI